MGDNPRKNLKWLEQELLAEEPVSPTYTASHEEDENLLDLVDMLIEEEETEEYPPIRNFANNYGRRPRAERIQQTHVPQFNPAAAVPVKTKKELRREAKQRKIAQKKANVNHNLKGLVFLAILELLGILAILGWWLQ